MISLGLSSLEFLSTRNTFGKKSLEMISRMLHLTSSVSSAKVKGARSLRAVRVSKQIVVEGENCGFIDNYLKQHDRYPNQFTSNVLFDEIPYKKLHICNIKACSNNTIVSVTDAEGKVIILKSCGTEGFKTAKKGTNIAAQTTAIALSQEAIQQGIQTAKVRVQGIGPGRLAAIKGLQLGGIQIVSITDNTHVSWNPPRSRKRRRI